MNIRETSPLQAEHDAQRRRYMDHALTYDEFYLWLAERIGASMLQVPFTVEQVRASSDPHLNDLPLAAWDRRDLAVRSMAFRAGMRSWSLSDPVCVLKAVARQAAKP